MLSQVTTVHEAMAERPGPSLPVDSGASASDTELESGESGDLGIESVMYNYKKNYLVSIIEHSGAFESIMG